MVLQSEPYSCKSREYILSVNIFRSDHNETKLKPNDTYPCDGREQKPITLKAEKRRLETRLKAAQGLDDEKKVKDLLRKQYDVMVEEINKLKKESLEE